MLALNKVLGFNSSLFEHAFVFTPPVPTQVHPVTHAVANTLKRVVILLACVLFFRTPMTPLSIAGEWMPLCVRLLACTSAHSVHIRTSLRLIHRNHRFLLLFCGERHGQGKEGISVSCSFFSSLAGTLSVGTGACLNEKPESARLLTCVISSPAFALLPLMSIVSVDIHLREVDILDVDESTGVCPVKFFRSMP